MKKSVTMQDVADYCGCSRATISRVLNNDKSVTPETYKLVHDAIEKLDYHPNSMARALSGGKSKIVAVVVPDGWKNQPYYINLLDAIEDVADSKGFHIILKRRKYIESVGELVSQKIVDGVIIRNMENYENADKLFMKMKRVGIPFVLIGQPVKDYSFIKVDNVGGGRVLADYFVKQGFKRILIISGPPNHIDTIDRTAGFKMGLIENGFDINNLVVREGDFSKDSGYRIAEKYLISDNVDAVFAHNDRTALGVILFCRDKGIKIPDDICIAGYDNNFFAEFLNPSLTTLKSPMSDIGTLAMETLTQMIENNDRPAARIILPPELIVRESCINKHKK